MELSSISAGKTEDEWTHVQRKKGKTSSFTQTATSISTPISHKMALQKQHSIEAHQAMGGHGLDIIPTLQSWAILLRQTPFYQLLIKSIPSGKRYKSLLSLGIGNFAQSRPALLQLSLVVCLQQDFLSTDSPCLNSDPCFTANEISICQSLGMTVPPLTMDSKSYPLFLTQADCLVFMPHCPYRLYAQLIWCNWPSLDSITLIGNSFESYSVRAIVPSIPSALDCVHLSAAYVRETPLLQDLLSQAISATIAPYIESAFNDTSMHSFALPPITMRPTLKDVLALPSIDSDV